MELRAESPFNDEAPPFTIVTPSVESSTPSSTEKINSNNYYYINPD